MYRIMAIALLLLILSTPSVFAAREIGATKRAMPFGSPENVFNVILETTKGDIVLEVHPEWSPLGAEHFRELVEDGYYDGAPWFRVIDGFVAQCGIAADPEMTAKWQDITFPDEHVIEGNLRGYVSYGKTAEPDSRSTHIFINYGNNSRLDNVGFNAFAYVSVGMEVADSLFITDENPTDTQERLTAEGISFFKELYPEGDVIIRAYVFEPKPYVKSCCMK